LKIKGEIKTEPILMTGDVGRMIEQRRLLGYGQAGQNVHESAFKKYYPLSNHGSLGFFRNLHEE